jgi:hypothetical protein
LDIEPPIRRMDVPAFRGRFCSKPSMESCFVQARPDSLVVAAAIRARINACQAETPTWITLRAKIA